MNMSNESAAWLERKYLDWQREGGKRASLTAFAKHLGISRDMLNNWMLRKRTPEKASLELLGSKLGWDIYEIVGEPRPDPMLTQIVKAWGELDDEVKRGIAELLQRASKRGNSGEPEKTVAATKRKRTR